MRQLNFHEVSKQQLRGKRNTNAGHRTWMAGEAKDFLVQISAVGYQDSSAVPRGAVLKVEHPRQVCWHLSQLASPQLAFPIHQIRQ